MNHEGHEVTKDNILCCSSCLCVLRGFIPPAADSARLTSTERGFVNKSIFRFIGTHFIGFNKTIDSYLRALDMHL
jgi:hypothetical protein